jgi:hypothetical protein
MDSVLKDLVGTDCFVYLDDLILFSKTAEEHAENLERVLERFDKANLQLHLGKCVIVQPEGKYFGYVLSDKGVSASSDRSQKLSDPLNAKDVRAFLGLVSFYRRLVANFAETAKPLTKLTRKEQEFYWGPSQQEAFEELKTKLCTTPVLAYPNFDLPFILTTDSSKVVVAGIL